MRVHLGEETVVKAEHIVGVFDLDNTTVAKDSRAFLADAEKGGRVFYVSYELPRSFVVCAEPDGTETVYVCQVSAQTIRKRLSEALR